MLKWWILFCGPIFVIAVPRFDPTAILRGILIPADAAIGSVVYRLRASDTNFAYPLSFETDKDVTFIEIETLNCSRFNSLCHANIILKKKLEAGRFYDFRVVTRNARGQSTSLSCSFQATNATTPVSEIFPGAPTLLMVSESARRNTELGTLQARGNPAREKPVLLELWGSPLFGLHQRLINDRDAEGTIILLGRLDYEKSTVHHLTILANDPWSDLEKDTRNIASWSLLVAILDEQDTPPVFTIAPPTTILDSKLKPGDLILQVHAEDGDKGNPRDIRYDLVPDGTPFLEFFNISENSGEVRLAKPLRELQTITHNDKPILLKVIADEVRSNPSEQPAQTTTVQLALIPPKPPSRMPQFTSSEYTVELDENSPPGTVLPLINAEVIAQDGVVLKLELLRNNGTFEIVPNVIEGRSKFSIKVKDQTFLDYERQHFLQCDITATELGDENRHYTAKAKLKILLRNLVDNPPKFLQSEWHADIPEGTAAGTSILKIEAYSTEMNTSDRVKYTRLFGSGSEFFKIDDKSGWITVEDSEKLNAEINYYFEFFAEASDDDGKGIASSTSIKINLIDVNDEVPKFDKNPYEFIVDVDRRSFTVPAFVKATDDDVTSPNNEVRYEFIEPNDILKIEPVSGEITIGRSWNKNEVTSFHVRGYDGGVPKHWSECEVRIYPPEGKTRKLVFIVSGRNPDRQLLSDTLTTIVGGPVSIDEVRSFSGYEPGAIDISNGSGKEKSIVETSVTSSSFENLDIDRIRRILDSREVKQTIIKESSAGSLWWIVLLLLLLIIIIGLILVFCCICEPCPLYVPPKKRKIGSTEVNRLVFRGSGNGKQSKSVQVAEWFGRKEAWSPQAAMVENEIDSIKKHELDRGSERDGKRQKQAAHQQDTIREQFYIREGNADILRLLTRDGEQQRPITLVEDQAYIIDNGKDILMKRYIDQQQEEAAKVNILLPNAIQKLQNEQELLEASLRQQNALLRQILLERERDLRLETQSLPAGTQTDQDAGTQTEPFFIRPPRRKTRSDNDASDFSDDEEISERLHRRRYKRKVEKKRKIKTPILEESESNLDYVEKPHKSSSRSSRLNYNHTKTSLLRQKTADNQRAQISRSAIKREVLREISATLLQSSGSESEEEIVYYKNESFGPDEYYSEDSLNNYTKKSVNNNSTSKLQKYASEADVRVERSKTLNSKKTLSQTDLTGKLEQTKKTNKKASGSRYMEWYKKSAENNTKRKIDSETPAKKENLIKRKSSVKKQTNEKLDATKSAAKKVKKKPIDVRNSTQEKQHDQKENVDITKVTKKMITEEQSTATGSVAEQTNKIGANGPEHPLLQHSERRFEIAYPRKVEEDVDSGIALTRPPIAQKKSVFTIAYDDMHTSQIRPESATSPPL